VTDKRTPFDDCIPRLRIASRGKNGDNLQASETSCVSWWLRCDDLLWLDSWRLTNNGFRYCIVVMSKCLNFYSTMIFVRAVF